MPKVERAGQSEYISKIYLFIYFNIENCDSDEVFESNVS